MCFGSQMQARAWALRADFVTGLRRLGEDGVFGGVVPLRRLLAAS